MSAAEEINAGDTVRMRPMDSTPSAERVVLDVRDDAYPGGLDGETYQQITFDGINWGPALGFDIVRRAS